MRLKDRQTTPNGGFFYDDPDLGRISTDGNFQKLVRLVEARQLARGFKVDNLEMIIEDQICSRQPKGKCFYTSGLGDMVARVVHQVASVVDSVAGTQLEQKARGCGSCGKRRNSLNALTSR